MSLLIMFLERVLLCYLLLVVVDVRFMVTVVLATGPTHPGPGAAAAAALAGLAGLHRAHRGSVGPGKGFYLFSKRILQ